MTAGDRNQQPTLGSDDGQAMVGHALGILGFNDAIEVTDHVLVAVNPDKSLVFQTMLPGRTLLGKVGDGPTWSVEFDAGVPASVVVAAIRAAVQDS